MKLLFALLIALFTAVAFGALPAPTANWSDFPISDAADFPGVFSAESLLDKPAGKDGPINVKDGHFYTSGPNGKRIRFLGVNFCFGASFPTHEQADGLAPRLARLGINAVRFHHMDNQPFPNGIFKRGDKKLDTLDPEALDRLDYLIAALKKNGIYADLNLHVSRAYTEVQPAGPGKLPSFDKIVDLFYPPLIDAQKKYAKDLLTHVNAYTHNAYADEPAVCMIEINNENTFFLWGGEQTLANIPDPCAAYLQKLWNRRLAAKYPTRDGLAAAWNAGAQPLGESLLKDAAFATVGKPGSPWALEQIRGAAMTAAPAADNRSVTFTIQKITPTAWHLQFMQGRLPLKNDQIYTVQFRASADTERDIQVSTAENHADWKNLGLTTLVHLSKPPKDFTLPFSATADEPDARLSFSLGQKTGSVTLADISFASGGIQGLAPEENPTTGTVARGNTGLAATPARQRDWYDFLQHLDETYFTDMGRFLREDLHVHAPITGTIGLGALGTLSQSKMDYVDAHAYWDHPQFPGRPWDPANWRLHNNAMVDSPEHSMFPGLAAIRVAGKPFTVTEYNHGAPNEWQAECVPLIATFAALQDWDAIYLFAWSHNSQYDRDYTDSFFDIKANPAKLCMLPAAARIFLSGAVAPLPATTPVFVSRGQSLGLAHRFYFSLWPQLVDTAHVTPDSLLRQRLAISFTPAPAAPAIPAAASDNRVTWTADGPGSGQFSFTDPRAAVFVGFPSKDQTISLGPVSLANISVPYLTATLVPADGHSPLTGGGPMLLTLIARTQNTDMQWNQQRNSVSTHWGAAPTQIEPVHATVSLPPGYSLTPIDNSGKPGPVLISRPSANRVDLPGTTCWYLLTAAP